jgi:predicted DNA-binding transcriptional regulator AlpA
MISHSNRLLRVGEVAELLGVSKSYIYKMSQTTDFPKPVVLGDENTKRSASRWVLTEVEDWVSSRPRGKEL